MGRKQDTRAAFRAAVFKRDNYQCVICGKKAVPEKSEDVLDAHHITPREEFPNGGYVAANGVSLCDPGKTGEDWSTGCHYKAEMVLRGEHFPVWESFSSDELYRRVKSDLLKARAADARHK